MKILKDIFKVALSNITTILSGVVVGFLVPKILSVEGYGLYKTFTLYASYLGLFTLGMVDGIVLKYGAKNYNELDRSQFRAYFKWCMLLQGFFTLSAVVASVIIGGDYGFILMLLGLNLLATNFLGYFQQISQITQRFNEYSIRKVLLSVFSIVFVIVLFLLYKNGYAISFRLYGGGVVSFNFILLMWYFFTYRDICFGKGLPLLGSFRRVLGLMAEGLPLMFANLSSILVLSLDRQFVNVLFTTTEYAIYAFAYSMMSLVAVATSAISMVLYPFLKRMDVGQFKDAYNKFLILITVFVFGMASCFYPLRIIVEWILPKYIDSLQIFKIIIPGVAISSAIHVIMHNYYKTLGQNKKYFNINLIVLLISVVTNLLAYELFGTMESISIASVITILIWYILADRILKNKCKSNIIKNLSYILTMIFVFYRIAPLQNAYLGFVAYLTVFFIISMIFYRSEIQYMKKIFLTK